MSAAARTTAPKPTRSPSPPPARSPSRRGDAIIHLSGDARFVLEVRKHTAARLMKPWTLLLPALLLAFPASADDETYRPIYQVKPSIDGHTTEYSRVLPFYKESIKDDISAAPEHKGPFREFLDIDSFPLGEDGTLGIFVELRSAVECGAKGCGLDIYAQDK